MKKYETKQSGKMAQYKSGMKRDETGDKSMPHLITDEMMIAISGLNTRKDMVSSMFRKWQRGEPVFHSLLRCIKDYGLLASEDIALRLGGVLARGGKHYGYWNWQKANSQEELDRFYESAERHLIQWMLNDPEDKEDHLAGALFNIMCAEWLRKKLKDK